MTMYFTLIVFHAIPSICDQCVYRLLICTLLCEGYLQSKKKKSSWLSGLTECIQSLFCTLKKEMS